MSMAHGLESRVPFLDHPLIEFAATVPADIKFSGGNTKHLLKRAFNADLPNAVLNRRDKMGFPVPLKEWFTGELHEFVQDIFRSHAARSRPFMNSDVVLSNLEQAGKFSRKTWGLLSLEIWHQMFHDRASEIQRSTKVAPALNVEG
jgi:asparagine synthase (glutamine-hydrolysing)